MKTAAVSPTQQGQQDQVAAVVVPEPNDVLCGRGCAIRSHLGNQYYLQLITQYRAEYKASMKGGKQQIVQKVVDAIRQKQGRFLKSHNETATKLAGGKPEWVEITEASALTKTSQAFRDLRVTDASTDNNKSTTVAATIAQHKQVHDASLSSSSAASSSSSSSEDDDKSKDSPDLHHDSERNTEDSSSESESDSDSDNNEPIQKQEQSLMSSPLKTVSSSSLGRHGSRPKLPTKSSKRPPAVPSSSSSILLVVPVDDDVLCGRGRSIRSHPGNQYYLQLITDFKAKYMASKKGGKLEIVRQVVEAIRSRNGRFLQRVSPPPPSSSFNKHSNNSADNNGLDGLWIPIDDKKAITKTSQAFRDLRVMDDSVTPTTAAAATSSSSASGPNKVIVKKSLEQNHSSKKSSHSASSSSAAASSSSSSSSDLDDHETAHKTKERDTPKKSNILQRMRNKKMLKSRKATLQLPSSSSQTVLLFKKNKPKDSAETSLSPRTVMLQKTLPSRKRVSASDSSNSVTKSIVQTKNAGSMKHSTVKPNDGTLNKLHKNDGDDKANGATKSRTKRNLPKHLFHPKKTVNMKSKDRKRRLGLIEEEDKGGGVGGGSSNDSPSLTNAKRTKLTNGHEETISDTETEESFPIHS